LSIKISSNSAHSKNDNSNSKKSIFNIFKKSKGKSSNQNAKLSTIKSSINSDIKQKIDRKKSSFSNGEVSVQIIGEVHLKQIDNHQ
jgi:hypothetical protein